MRLQVIAYKMKEEPAVDVDLVLYSGGREVVVLFDGVHS